eukprot:scaffold10765_cov51-Cyclotella_meneghiniana.AAC.4
MALLLPLSKLCAEEIWMLRLVVSLRMRTNAIAKNSGANRTTQEELSQAKLFGLRIRNRYRRNSEE